MIKTFSLKIYARVIVPGAFLLFGLTNAAAQSFSLEQIKGYPYPTELTASANTPRIAWVFNERGVRNVWVAEGPEYAPRKLTNYMTDDGLDLVSLVISPDGKWVVFVRRIGGQLARRAGERGIEPRRSKNADLERAIFRRRAESFGGSQRAHPFAKKRYSCI